MAQVRWRAPLAGGAFQYGCSTVEAWPKSTSTASITRHETAMACPNTAFVRVPLTKMPKALGTLMSWLKQATRPAKAQVQSALT